jgi:DNA-binding NtrC family response regulator
MMGKNSPGTNSSEDQLVFPPDEVVFGSTARMRSIRAQAEKVCGANIPVLIQGEVGSGKETLARWIHRHSPWSAGPFIKVNLAAIPGTLLQSELFGYQPGAFTGANNAKMGRVEMAQGGTLFLDQVTDLEHSIQAKLLQVLQDGCFTRLGDEEERKLEARVICASTRRLDEVVAAGTFREDLYYRINVFGVKLPPLSERREDIPAIANYLLTELNLRFHREAPTLESSTLRLMQSRKWRGNIREMENWIARYVLLGEQELLTESDASRSAVAGAGSTSTGEAIPLKQIARQARRAASRELILRTLEANRWNRRKSAKELKVSYRTLLSEIRAIGLPPRIHQRKMTSTELKARSSPPATD